MPLVYYVSDLEKNGTLDAERLLRLLGVNVNEEVSHALMNF